MHTQDTSQVPDLSPLIDDPNSSITENSPQKKSSHHHNNHSNKNKALIIAILLFFLITLPVIAVFVAQRQQIGDIRQQAAVITVPTKTSTPVPPQRPTNTPVPPQRPTNTPVPPQRPTNTPVPPQRPTNTPVPPQRPTNTPVPPQRPTNTPVPPQRPTNTPVPPQRPTNTPVPPQRPTNTPVPPQRPINTPVPPQRPTIINRQCQTEGSKICSNGVLYHCIGGMLIEEGPCPPKTSTPVSTTRPTNPPTQRPTNTPTISASCFVDNPNVVNSYITISNCPGQYQLLTFWNNAPRGTSHSSCVGTSTNGSSQMVGNGTYRPDGPCGRCVQIDVVVNGQSYGTAKYTGDCSSPTNTATPNVIPTNTPPARPTNTPPARPTNTPPARPTNTPVAGQCLNIKIYRNDVLINPNTLKPGDNIVIAIVGTNAAQARIRINNEADWRISSERNSKGEWIFNYTIPTDGTRTFSIVGELSIVNVWR